MFIIYNGTYSIKMDIGNKGLHKSKLHWLTEFKKGIMAYFEKYEKVFSCFYAKQFVKYMV